MENKLNEKINRLLEKADKKFKVAQNLFKDESYDDSISRAYYAMYQAATALLLTKDIICKTHSGLLQMFSLHFIKRVSEKSLGATIQPCIIRPRRGHKGK